MSRTTGDEEPTAQLTVLTDDEHARGIQTIRSHRASLYSRRRGV